ncbi:MAG: LysM peptidoglycan-binding domain-containing protein [Planctomycetes bacterium]|nr:LysM peptidoglycan-binding domain-containing protein [Planctomycetota bacterium]
MRTLLALVAFVLALASAVWFKTAPNDLPPTTAPHDNSIGIMTLGIDSSEASFTKPETESKPVAAVSESTLVNPKDTAATTPVPEVVVHQPKIPPQPEPATDPLQPIAEGPLNYTVQSGDTMYRIIKRCYKTYSEDILQSVADANNLRDPSAINIGDELVLPLIAGVSAPTMR